MTALDPHAEKAGRREAALRRCEHALPTERSKQEFSDVFTKVIEVAKK
jgi:hypothetical protein